MTFVLRASLAAAFALAVTISAYAQITAATVSGTVKDETGGVLPGVSIEVKNLDTGLSRTAITDGNGSFTIPGLPPGRYEARATLQGFANVVERDIRLAVAQQAALNVAMKVSAAAETINVVGAATLVDTQSAALSAVVTEKTIEQLPLNGRNYIDLALLQPGVASFYEKDSNASSNRGTKFN
ncbi:MAG TPA: carboxypeptidase-like regulatory domain-containing protein, partial [Vicinamibacterales bacterium]|nr:carboxypeptidase-like regulatory domain-containing protein [Vicinamibacterales bacterium]